MANFSGYTQVSYQESLFALVFLPVLLLGGLGLILLPNPVG